MFKLSAKSVALPAFLFATSLAHASDHASHYSVPLVHDNMQAAEMSTFFLNSDQTLVVKKCDACEEQLLTLVQTTKLWLVNKDHSHTLIDKSSLDQYRFVENTVFYDLASEAIHHIYFYQ